MLNLIDMFVLVIMALMIFQCVSLLRQNRYRVGDISRFFIKKGTITPACAEVAHINDVEGPMSGESASEMVSTAEASTAVTATTGETSEETDRPGRTSKSLIVEQRIMQIIEDEKAYLDDSLTLESIAARLEMTPKKLSAFYSNHFDVPFRTMINNYRVEAVKNYLLENPTATQDVVASECSYKDAASLNRKFKEAAGETPLMWLAKQTKS